MSFVEKMDMTYSYKPALLLSLLDNLDNFGRAPIDAVVASFIRFYADRKAQGLPPEKPNSLFAQDEIPEKEAKALLLRYPFKRFADMRFLSYSRDLDQLTLDRDIHKRLTREDVETIRGVCLRKLGKYFKKCVIVHWSKIC